MPEKSPLSGSFIRGRDPQFCARVAMSKLAVDRSAPGMQVNTAPELPIHSFDLTLLYISWEDVPNFPPIEMKVRSVFLEVFSGKAGLTLAMRRSGWSVLPLIDIVIEGEVLAKTDILDQAVMQKVQNWLQSGVVALVHFGTPCTTFSRARKHGDGGPPPIRSEKFLNGIPGISDADLEKVQLGTKFLDISLFLGDMVAAHGGHWTIENPGSSMLWIMPQTVQHTDKHSAKVFKLDMCAFGSEHMKPTTFACSHSCLAGIVRKFTCHSKALSWSTALRCSGQSLLKFIPSCSASSMPNMRQVLDFMSLLLLLHLVCTSSS